MREVIAFGIVIVLVHALVLWWRDDGAKLEVSRPATTESAEEADSASPPGVSSPRRDAKPKGFNPMHPWLP
jgi:hypothetical protein